MNHYQCEKCGTAIKSTSTPSTEGCPKGSSHKWHKLMRRNGFREGLPDGIKPILLVTGGCLVLAALMLGYIALLLMLLRGTFWISENVHPWTAQAAKIALFFVVPASVVLSCFRQARGIGRSGLTLSSSIVGWNLLVWAFIVANTLVGEFWVVVGFLSFGLGVIVLRMIEVARTANQLLALASIFLTIYSSLFGILFAVVAVVPIAIIAAALNGQWTVVGQMLLSIVAVYMLRAVGNRLARSNLVKQP
jgi:hypothetical protein